MEKQLGIIGRVEKISFPELGFFNLDAKVDTGAYTTTIHCHHINEKEVNGRKVLCFYLLDPDHPVYEHKELRFDSYGRKQFRNSFGTREERYVIRTLIRLGRKKIRAVVSLTDRGNMRYPVLIGRKLLKNKMLVDVSARYLLPQAILKKKKN